MEMQMLVSIDCINELLSRFFDRHFIDLLMELKLKQRKKDIKLSEIVKNWIHMIIECYPVVSFHWIYQNF